MSKELDIYKVLVDRNPYKLNRAEIRRTIESKYSDSEIKKALDGLLEKRIITKIGRDYSAGRVPIVNNEVHKAIIEDRKIFSSDPFGFAYTGNSARTRLMENRNAVLNNMLFWNLEIHLDSIRFPMGIPIEKYEKDNWWFLSI